jgi:GNAT superfamily N-acetyltransferase
MENITYGEANEADIPALVGLLGALFGIEKDFSADVGKQKIGLALLLKNPQTATIQIARNANGIAIGMVSAQLVISTAQGAPSAWVEDMIVSQDYRAQGVGRLLLESALEWAKDKGATRAQLLVDLDNEPALGYYEHLGWQTSRMGMRRLLIK